MKPESMAEKVEARRASDPKPRTSAKYLTAGKTFYIQLDASLEDCEGLYSNGAGELFLNPFSGGPLLINGEGWNKA